MRAAFLSPLPPSRTGIAHYASMVLPALQERLDVTAFASMEGYERVAFDIALYQLGNNPHHEWIYREALAHPGVVVLHDIVLHHLIVEMTLARGDADAYAAALAASHGAVGEAWARGRAIGLHDEIGNFLLPASVELANRSRAVVVHNRWAQDRLRSLGVATPIVVVPHPADPAAVPDPSRRDEVRRRLGIAPGDRVIGFFGFLTSAKRASVVLEAFARAGRAGLKLLIVGEPAPDIDVSSLQRGGVITTGFVPDSDFAGYYAAADRLVNLRYPSAGETSGTVIRAFAAGKPVAVSDYAQFAELPDSCAFKVPLGPGEVEALTEFFVGELDEAAITSAQRQWIDACASMDLTVKGYAEALNTASSGEQTPIGATGVPREIPLFPKLSVVHAAAGQVVLRNDGDAPLRARVYGQPGYRLLAKLFRDGRETADRWIELPCDLAPGEEAAVDVPFEAGAGLRLYHAMESMPMLEPEAWYAAAL